MTSDVAERVGFEPTLLSQTAFRERHHQPLGHLSAGEDISGYLLSPIAGLSDKCSAGGYGSALPVSPARLAGR